MAIPKLEDVSGVGAASAAALRAKGIRSVRALSLASDEKIASVKGFGVARAARIRAAATSLMSTPVKRPAAPVRRPRTAAARRTSRPAAAAAAPMSPATPLSAKVEAAEEAVARLTKRKKPGEKPAATASPGAGLTKKKPAAKGEKDKGKKADRKKADKKKARKKAEKKADKKAGKKKGKKGGKKKK